MKVNEQLDHVILLLPYSYLTDPPAWITNNFTLSPGGRHADNKTENRLILFADGTYLELIAFINDDPAKRKGHWWDKPFGVVDYALGTPPSTPLDYASLVARLDASRTQISYAAPQPGGRHTDGHDIRWRVTFPTGVARGNVPFWCEDETQRDWRVPCTKANTTHPCGARGMGGVVLEVAPERLERLATATAAVLDVATSDGGRYEVGAPNEVEGLRAAAIRLQARAEEGEGRELALTLVLQVGAERVPEPICERIGEDGLVSIVFE